MEGFLTAPPVVFPVPHHRILPPAVKEQLGDIKSVRPAVLGPYAQKTVNSDEWVSMAIDVSGTGNHIELDVVMKKTNGAWTVERAKGNGRNFNLD